MRCSCSGKQSEIIFRKSSDGVAKRQRTAAVQNLADSLGGTANADAFWTAAVPCRFAAQEQVYFENWYE